MVLGFELNKQETLNTHCVHLLAARCMRYMRCGISWHRVMWHFAVKKSGSVVPCVDWDHVQMRR